MTRYSPPRTTPSHKEEHDEGACDRVDVTAARVIVDRAKRGNAMTRDLVIGIDSSTTAAKAVVWDQNGRAVAEGRATFELSSPQPGWGEQNPEDWWTATRNAIRRAAQTVDTRRLAAISITHQRETFACVTEDGHPLRPAMLWLDSRAFAEVAEFGTERVHRVTGKPPNPTPAWYKLQWLRRHEPETLDRTERVVDVQAFLVHKILGAWKTCWASADPLGVLDMQTFDYDDELLSAVGLTGSRCPRCTNPARCSARSRPTSPTSSACRPASPWSPASATASRRDWAWASSSPGRPTSTWAPPWSPGATARPTRPASSSGCWPAGCRGATCSRP